MKCKKHPSYAVKREPRAQCQACWLMWLAQSVKQLQNRADIQEALEAERFW